MTPNFDALTEIRNIINNTLYPTMGDSLISHRDRANKYEDALFKIASTVDAYKTIQSYAGSVRCHECKEEFWYKYEDIIDEVYVKCPDCGELLCILD